MTTATAPPGTARSAPNLFREFREFLDKYGVIGLAIAILIGTAVTRLVPALVTDIVNPVVLAFLPGGDWRAAVWDPPVFDPILWGHALGELENFLIIAAVVFLSAKVALREGTVAKE